MTLGTLALGTAPLGDDDNPIQFVGHGYRAQLNPPVLSFAGQGFRAGLASTFEITPQISFTGQGYQVTPEFLGGFEFAGSGYSYTPTLTLQPDYNVNFTGRGYSASMLASMTGVEVISFTGRGYSYTPELLGGFEFAGRGYTSSLSATVETAELITFTGYGYAASLSATVESIVDIQFTGRGYKAELLKDISFYGCGYAVSPVISVGFDSTYAEAFVLNLTSNAVSRYQNYPFMHLAKIGSKYYSIDSAGLYELTGTTDGEVAVNGTIKTRDTDFDIFQSKNVPYMYLNGDDDYQVTPYVDDAATGTFNSGFGGRRAKLARGAKGRYWYFEVSGISELYGVEYLPDGLSRRVK